MIQRSFFFTALAGSMAVVLVLANILATLIEPGPVGPFVLSAGFIAFPLVYIMSDVISDVYGYKASRQVSMLVLLGNILLVLLMVLMYKIYGDEHAAVIAPLATQSWIIVVASMVAAQLGNWVNDILFNMIKNLTNWPFLIRALASSIVGEFVDSGIFVTFGLAIAFHIPGMLLPWMVVSAACFKLIVEVLLYPITAALRKLGRKMDPEGYERTSSMRIWG